MIRSASERIAAAFHRFLDESPRRSGECPLAIRTGESFITSRSFRVGDRRLILIEARPGINLKAVADRLRESLDRLPRDEDGLREIVFAVAGPNVARDSQQILCLGVRAIPLHQAIADIIGLPAGWLDHQQKVIDHIRAQILEPLRADSEYQIARLRVPAENGEPDEDALGWLERWSLGQLASAAGRLIYLRAEAGKGKSTTFAELAHQYLARNDGPIPLLIPLRNLPHSAGASWEKIAGTIGVVGGTAADLGRAVRAGLVMLLLDGLDEVSGRYDPNVIREIIQAVSQQACGPAALLAFSGRTTEGMLLDPKVAYMRTLELPEIGGQEFRRYANQVVQAIAPKWPSLAPQVGELISSDEELKDRKFTAADQEHLLQWVLFNFTDFGKDRSLFFVQGLTCLGRDMQLRGKKPIYVWQPETPPKVLLCGLYEACICAASLACIRERLKVEEEAHPLFTPARQLDVATWLAVLASVDDATRSGFPTPNQLIADKFNLDPVNQNEALTAIIRQMQKHALLYASGDLSGGDWRPGFLSDWVRVALLVRAWINRAEMGAGTSKGEALARGIAAAQRARNAYQYIFPDRITRPDDVSLGELVTTLVQAANDESPEACGNFWFLMQGLPDDLRARVAEHPKRVVELTDFSQFEFEGLDFGPEFSANLAVFVRTQFIGCQFRGCQFTQCDFTWASFVNCTFDSVLFQYCEGPLHFEDCDEIRKTRFAEVRSPELPAWKYSRCYFAAGSRVEQQNLPRNDKYGPIAAFDCCVCEEDPATVLAGPELGQARQQFTGLRLKPSGPATDPGVECLRQLIRPFFPPQANHWITYQARDYIRSSAIGRGVFPDGSPGVTELTGFLTSEGFTKGGRQGHLYAPWSDVAGATRVELRSEFSAFLMNEASRGLTIRRLLEKIRRAATWDR